MVQSLLLVFINFDNERLYKDNISRKFVSANHATIKKLKKRGICWKNHPEKKMK